MAPPNAVGRTDAGAPEHKTEPVGRIAAGESTLTREIEAWLEYLARNGRSPNTVAAWRRTVTNGCRLAGITRPGEITFSAIERLIGEQRQRGAWSASTANGTLSAFKSFDRWKKRVQANDLQAAEGMRDLEPGDGSRAATTDEIRTHVRTALYWQTADGRARSNRALYVLALALAGCREEEPAHWDWRHVALDDPIPFIEWQPSWHKNKRKMRVALAPELAEKLRENPPEQRVGPVFTTKPPKDVFRRDADRAEIPYTDARGRAYTPHSLRKWHRTTLISLGCPESLADKLMRHHSLRGRYTDPSLEEQASWLGKLPRLWPENGTAQPPTRTGASKKVGAKAQEALAKPHGRADTQGATSTMAPPNHISNPRRVQPSGHGVEVAFDPSGRGVGSSCVVGGKPSGSQHMADQAAVFTAEVSAFGAQPLARTLAAFAAELRAFADLLDGGVGGLPHGSAHGSGQAG